jgi:hypothetical protein
MKAIVFLCVFSFLSVPVVLGQTRSYGLPAGAVIVERRSVKPGRVLILWMMRPKKNPRETPGEQYTCPEETRGSFYSGPARVSLAQLKPYRIINTIELIPEYIEEDELELPYRIHKGSYYHVEGVAEGEEGTPTLMQLKDYNGDGKAHEFALFDALACMGLQTTLIGYSESQDKVIQYLIRLKVLAGKGQTVEDKLWVDYLFSQKPVRPGHWKFEIDYRGRGGTLNQYEISYNKQAERFEGQLRYISGDE